MAAFEYTSEQSPCKIINPASWKIKDTRFISAPFPISDKQQIGRFSKKPSIYMCVCLSHSGKCLLQRLESFSKVRRLWFGQALLVKVIGCLGVRSLLESNQAAVQNIRDSFSARHTCKIVFKTCQLSDLSYMFLTQFIIRICTEHLEFCCFLKESIVSWGKCDLHFRLGINPDLRFVLNVLLTHENKYLRKQS